MTDKEIKEELEERLSVISAQKELIDKLVEVVKYSLKEAKVNLGHCTDNEDRFYVQHHIDMCQQVLKDC